MKPESSIVPFNFHGKEVRTLAINGLPWFVAADVCRVLALGNPSMAVNGNKKTGNAGLDDDEKGIMINDTPGGQQKILCVNESGLYALIFKSRKAEAKKFKKWVTSEVLPSIRQTGSYSIPADPMAQLNGMLKAMVQNAFNCGVSASALNMIAPLGKLGDLSRNGLPKTGIRRAAYVAAPCRKLEALSLMKQLELIEILHEEEQARRNHYLGLGA